MRGQGRLSESNIADAMREIRVALLEADVNQKVAMDFIEQVRAECLGDEVLRSVTPGQQVVKVVNDKLVELMGEKAAPLTFKNKPAVIMMIGLHGSGKTTSSAKLANLVKKQGRNPILVAADVYRPAAIDQLEILGDDTGVPVHVERGNRNVPAIARNAWERARLENFDTVIIDTAGRLQIDEAMLRELVLIKQAVNAGEVLLVADAALGQEAVSVAEHFHRDLNISGVILSKLDGDARGGAALSIRKVAECPIKFVGVGEKIEDLEVFHPDRMASRILGMGDVVSLVEKASEQIEEEEAARLEEKLRKNKFDFEDFLQQIRQMKKMGGLESVLKMLPGGDAMANSAGMDESRTVRMEAAILSMTPGERRRPDIIDFSRRKRIAKGSGTSLELVGQLIKQFLMMRKMMKKTGLVQKMMSGGLSGLGAMGMGGLSRQIGGAGATKKKKKKRRKRSKRRR